MQTCYQPDLMHARFDVGGKTRNIAFQLVLRQCWKTSMTSCTSFVARFSLPLCCKGTGQEKLLSQNCFLGENRMFLKKYVKARHILFLQNIIKMFGDKHVVDRGAESHFLNHKLPVSDLDLITSASSTHNFRHSWEMKRDSDVIIYCHSLDGIKVECLYELSSNWTPRSPRTLHARFRTRLYTKDLFGGIGRLIKVSKPQSHKYRP